MLGDIVILWANLHLNYYEKINYLLDLLLFYNGKFQPFWTGNNSLYQGR